MLERLVIGLALIILLLVAALVLYYVDICLHEAKLRREHLAERAADELVNIQLHEINACP